MEFSEEKIKSVIANLPKSIRETVESDELINAAEEIGADQNLYVSQIGALEQECKLTLIGLHKSSDFISNLKKELEIDEKKAEALQKEVNEKIFIPLRKNLVAHQSSGDESSMSKADILNEIENPSEHIIPVTKTSTVSSDIQTAPHADASEDPPMVTAWKRQPIVISSKLLDDKLSEIVKLPPKHVDIVVDVAAMDEAEEEHKHRKEEANKLKEQQKIDAEKRIAQKATVDTNAGAVSTQKSVDGIKPRTNGFPFGKKDLPPLRVRKDYEADPYRESVE
jgi:hypothetical protein